MIESGRGGLVVATRAQVLPVILLPVALGTVYAFAISGHLAWKWFGVAMLGAGALHLAANVINDVFDIRSGADDFADEHEDSIRTGSPYATPGIATGLLVLAAACGVVLAIYRGPMVLVFGAIGGLLAFGYVVPPFALGYRGRGLGELAILIAFGPLPVAGAYYVQLPSAADSYSGPISSAFLGVPLFVWTLAFFPGLLTMLVLYHHHFLHHGADRMAGKMTPVAAWGPETALKLSRPVLVLAGLLLVGLAWVKVIPWWSLAALPPLSLAWSGIRRAAAGLDLAAYLLLLRASAATSVASQGILIAALALLRV